MTPPEPPDASDPAARPWWETAAHRRAGRRRDRIVAEIEKNRRGGHAAPTWALAAILLALVGAWAALIVLS